MNHELGMHLKLTLIIPPTERRPLPTQMELTINLPPTADINSMLKGTAETLDAFARLTVAELTVAQKDKAKS